MRFFTAALATAAVALFAGAHGQTCNSDQYGHDTTATDLAPLLSPKARISMRSMTNSTQFEEMTIRYSRTSVPDISAFISVGTPEDVGVIIKYANSHSREILAGNRRHAWSRTLSRTRNAIMIDISTLKNITINTKANTITVGGGVSVGDIMPALQAVGKETTTGTCDCVGFLGASLGGGHGRLQGRHGLMADNILSVRLTTATGEVITVSDTSHSDLFWALRGAGHNFGIITEATYKIYDAANGGMQYTTNKVYDTVYMTEMFEAMNNFQVPADYSALLNVLLEANTSTPRMVLNFVSSEPEAAAKAQFASAFGHIPYISSIEAVLPWASVNGRGLTGTGDFACGNRARKRIAGVATTRYNTTAILEVFEKYKNFATRPGAGAARMIFESYSVKSVQKVDPDSTAYPWRAETGVVLMNAGYTDDARADEAEDWLLEAMAIMHASSGFPRPALYMNYASGTEGFGAMYGYDKWRQEKLKKLKKEWDPHCVFSWFNPIPIECQP
ncbi:hypothetical protein DFP73DRAFT_395574 [Morchella snyderi]|nr:hypothetical protein DFP73DRAFT_395574 [Morchella snyderi]